MTNNGMTFRDFVRESGFKILSIARLSQAEYALVLYVMNSAVSGLDQLVTTDGELALAIGIDELDIHKALVNLSDRGIIRIGYSDSSYASKRPSFCLSFHFDVSRWQLDSGTAATSSDAVIFPFRRHGHTTLQVLDGQKRNVHGDREAQFQTWRRVFDSFLRNRDLSEEESIRAEEAAKILTETHAVDQILLLIRHFNHRIPTLSLLGSNWQHYQELFEREVQRVDLSDARAKHGELDERLRRSAEETIGKKIELELNEEEMTVLQILKGHRHPRRQLFWAYQLRSRYPNLANFFTVNLGLMLPVTTLGTVVKRNFDET